MLRGIAWQQKEGRRTSPHPTHNPDHALSLSFDSALEKSIEGLRPPDGFLLAHSDPSAKLLLSQVKVILLRLQPGLPVNRSQFLSVLETARSVACEKG
jgi:hypothetical protein